MAVLPDIADWHNACHCYNFYNAWRVGEGEGVINFDRLEVGYYSCRQMGKWGAVLLILDYGREDAETRDLYL